MPCKSCSASLLATFLRGVLPQRTHHDFVRRCPPTILQRPFSVVFRPQYPSASQSAQRAVTTEDLSTKDVYIPFDSKPVDSSSLMEGESHGRRSQRSNQWPSFQGHAPSQPSIPARPTEKRHNDESIAGLETDSSSSLLELSPESIEALHKEAVAARTAGPSQPPQPSPEERPPHRLRTPSASKPLAATSPTTKPAPAESPRPPRHGSEPWQMQKAALATKLSGASWTPLKRLSPDALEGIRALHAQYPEKYTTPVLAAQFEVSPDVIRRVLKGRWRPNEGEDEERRLRWNRRGQRIWEKSAALGVKPPKKWREMGVGRDYRLSRLRLMERGRGASAPRRVEHRKPGVDIEINQRVTHAARSTRRRGGEEGDDRLSARIL
ncbi:MAG: Required for respiratory growth protein 9 mitochondrial [Piccolia ochrophora]|nr:MAG: Required for respiratory growth protein 9 mitochondrial [Piccolia ochrophora]